MPSRRAGARLAREAVAAGRRTVHTVRTSSAGAASCSSASFQRVENAPGRNRTCDLALRRRALYPLSYRRSRLSLVIRLKTARSLVGDHSCQGKQSSTPEGYRNLYLCDRIQPGRSPCGSDLTKYPAHRSRRGDGGTSHKVGKRSRRRFASLIFYAVSRARTIITRSLLLSRSKGATDCLWAFCGVQTES